MLGLTRLDALRYCNWMENGCLTEKEAGEKAIMITETGSYELSDNEILSTNLEAIYHLVENEDKQNGETIFSIATRFVPYQTSPLMMFGGSAVEKKKIDSQHRNFERDRSDYKEQPDRSTGIATVREDNYSNVIATAAENKFDLSTYSRHFNPIINEEILRKMIRTPNSSLKLPLIKAATILTGITGEKVFSTLYQPKGQLHEISPHPKAKDITISKKVAFPVFNNRDTFAAQREINNIIRRVVNPSSVYITASLDRFLPFIKKVIDPTIKNREHVQKTIVLTPLAANPYCSNTPLSKTAEVSSIFSKLRNSKLGINQFVAFCEESPWDKEMLENSRIMAEIEKNFIFASDLAYLTSTATQERQNSSRDLNVHWKKIEDEIKNILPAITGRITTLNKKFGEKANDTKAKNYWEKELERAKNLEAQINHLFYEVEANKFYADVPSSSDGSKKNQLQYYNDVIAQHEQHIKAINDCIISAKEALDKVKNNQKLEAYWKQKYSDAKQEKALVYRDLIKEKNNKIKFERSSNQNSDAKRMDIVIRLINEKASTIDTKMSESFQRLVRDSLSIIKANPAKEFDVSERKAYVEFRDIFLERNREYDTFVKELKESQYFVNDKNLRDKKINDIRSQQESIEPLLAIIEGLIDSFDTEKDGALLWTGWNLGNTELAEYYAKETKKKTIQMTPGGKFLTSFTSHAIFNDKTAFMRDKINDDMIGNQLWIPASDNFARSASGNVYAIIPKVSLGNGVYFRIEKPALQDNKNVTVVFEAIHFSEIVKFKCEEAAFKKKHKRVKLRQIFKQTTKNYLFSGMILPIFKQLQALLTVKPSRLKQMKNQK